MMHFRQATIVLDQQEYRLQTGKINSFEHWYADFQCTQEGTQQERFSLFIHPKQDVLVTRIELQFDLPSAAFTALTTNALLSSGGSGEQGFNDKTRPPEGFFKGDTSYLSIPNGKGLLVSWSHIFFKSGNNSVLAASLDEQAGFTYFLYDTNQQVLYVRKDLGNGMHMTHSFPALDFWWGKGSEPIVWAQFGQLMNRPKPNGIKSLVWTTDIDTQALGIEHNIEVITASGLPFTHFCLGSEWAGRAGDWLSNPKYAVEKWVPLIRQHGLRPAITFSPFIAALDSDLARRHPEWLAQQQGKPVVIKTATGADAYALNVYHGGVREYLSGVFHLLGDRWGYEMFFLHDFFAACAVALPEKNRGQQLEEASSLTRQLAGDRVVIAAHVPAGAVNRHFDGVQIDKGISNQLEARLRSENLGLMPNFAAQSWRNNPVVVAATVVPLQVTKDAKSANAQYTMLMVHALLNDIIIISGRFMDYSPELQSELAEALFCIDTQLKSVVRLPSGVFKISFDKDGQRFEAFVNLYPKKIPVSDQQRTFDLEAFETIVF